MVLKIAPSMYERQHSYQLFLIHLAILSATTTLVPYILLHAGHAKKFPK